MKNRLFEKVRLFEQQKCINNNSNKCIIVLVKNNNKIQIFIYLKKLINSPNEQINFFCEMN